MAEREDLGASAAAAEKRVVPGNRTIVPQPQHLAVDAVETLRLIAERRARREIHHALAVEGDARAAAVSRLAGTEQGLDVRQRVARQGCALERHDAEPRGGPLAFGRRHPSRLIERETDPMVLREI